MLDPEAVAVVSNLKSDEIPGKLDSNHNLQLVLYTNPKILSMSMANCMGFVNDVEGMGIDKGSKAFTRSLLVLNRLNRNIVKRKLEDRELGFAKEEVGSFLAILF